MADWRRTLELKDVWYANLPIGKLSAIVAERLAKLRPFQIESLDEEKVELADEFLCLSKDEEATVQDFDEILERLYDWADTPLDKHWNGKKACWVKTF